MEYQEMLRRTVEAGLNNQTAFRMFVRLVTDTLVCLGWNYAAARRFLLGLQGQLVPDLYAWEQRVHNELAARGTYNQLDILMLERACDWVHDLRGDIIHRGTVMDYGCGSGYFAGLLKADYCCDVTGADIKNCLKIDVPFVPIVNCEAQTTQQYERLFLNTVSHHSVDPRRTIEDAWRLVVPGGILIMVESVIGGPFHSFLVTALVDVWYNHIIHYDADPGRKTYVPCEFKQTLDWKSLLFRITGREAEVTPLGIHMVLNPEDHVKFRVSKPR